MTSYLLKKGFTRGSVNKTLFVRYKNQGVLIAQVYVDDIFFGSTIYKHTQEFADVMTCEFEMSMDGELNFFLGLQVRQREDGIFISQSMYAREIMKKFSLERAKHASTPMSVSTKLCKDASGKDVQQTLYRSMIGKLLYLTANRPDIAFSVGVCARF